MMQETRPNLNFVELAVWVKQRKGPNALILIFLIAWCLWGRRNKKVYENTLIDPFYAIEIAIFNQNLYRNVCRTTPEGFKRLGYWQPLQANAYKLNTGGALFFDTKEAGIGAILRDGKGNLVMAISKKEKELVQPGTIECLAIFCGFQFCLQQGVKDVVVELDCQTTVIELQSSPTFFLPGQPSLGH